MTRNRDSSASLNLWLGVEAAAEPAPAPAPKTSVQVLVTCKPQFVMRHAFTASSHFHSKQSHRRGGEFQHNARTVSCITSWVDNLSPLRYTRWSTKVLEAPVTSEGV